MAQTKTEMASSVSNQQALVKRLIGNNRPKPSKTVIPGGQSILDEVDQTMLERAVFNYLRRHRRKRHRRLVHRARAPKLPRTIYSPI